MMDITIGVPVVLAIVEMMKIAGLKSKWAPLTSVALGLLLFFFFGPAYLNENLFMGLLTGLSASGLYSGAKATVK